ncbi:isochorismatase family protein [Asaia lannensis]|uniref:isochorismatase n=1 Tax=Asaia lannensis NBRC 102526 TaxID=1307926 RepID=A0ABT1CLW2_9PROT|nr:isochorismatase family protein [Asaia lannensis]MCO6161009.1 isochorismatase family protein [Asaia lannensis NBRC 102526]GBQ95560.1 isochorismate hydrolase [Asaia lannensis NBRC 102526]
MTIPRLPDYDMPIWSNLADNLKQTARVDWDFEPERAVLLIHDMQRYFTQFYGENSALMAELIEKIAKLRAHCRSLGIPIVYTAQPPEQPQSDRALLNDMWGPGITASDPALAAIVSELAPDTRDVVLTKWRYSAFTRSDLRDRMQSWKRDQLLICGVYASIGCMTTALDAFMQDIRPFLIADAVADFSLDDHLLALDYVGRRCGRVLGLDDILKTSSTSNETCLEESIKALLDDEVDSLPPDDNLLDYGLNSMRVMALVAQWRRQGLDISFEDLARKPSLNAWTALYTEKRNLSASASLRSVERT